MLLLPSVLLGLILALALAGSASAVQAPVINAPSADQGVEPTHFSPLSIERTTVFAADGYVSGIHWSSWGEGEATGTGAVVLHPYEPQITGTSAVTVTLSGLEDCAGVMVYSSYALALLPGQAEPERWSTVQSGSFPCQVGGDGFAQRSGRRIGCFVGFLHRPLSDPEHLREQPVGWTPHLPGSGVTAFCDLRWTQWGGPVAIGEGLRENLSVDHPAERNWPVKLELMQPVWCPRAAQASPFNGGGEEAQHSLPALAYSVVKLTEYGPPRLPTPKTLSSYGYRGLKGRVYWQRLGSVKPGACGL